MKKLIRLETSPKQTCCEVYSEGWQALKVAGYCFSAGLCFNVLFANALLTFAPANLNQIYGYRGVEIHVQRNQKFN